MSAPPLVAIIGLLALSGCVAARPAAPRCPGGQPAALVGQNIGAVRIAPGQVHRIVVPDAAASEAFAPARLTIRVDDKGWITAAACG